MDDRRIPPARPRDPEAHERLMEFQHLLTIEGNPLLPEELAIFEMFDREGWSDEQELTFINDLIDRRVGKA